MLLIKLCACAPCLKPRMQEAKSVLKHYLKVRIEFSIHIILVTDIKHYIIQTLCQCLVYARALRATAQGSSKQFPEK